MEIQREQNVASYAVVPLIDSANRPDYKASPTLATGDVKVIRHTGGSWNVANIGTLPSVITGATTQVLVTLTATELNPDDSKYPVIVQFIDAAGAEWDDQTIIIWTRPVVSNVTELDGGSQSLTDLKDFADAGYDPATNKVEGVKLVDTTTTNTDMVGTDNAALASALTTHDGKLDTVDTVVDGIQSDLDNATDGLGAIKAAVDTVDTVVDGIQTDLDNGIDGLGAIKTAVDANQTDLTNIETKVDTVDTVVDGIQSDLDNATDGLGAIKAAVDANQADLTNIESKVDTVDTVVDGIQTDLDNATDGLGAIKAAVDANQADLTTIEGKVDTVDTVVDSILDDTGTSGVVLANDAITAAKFDETTAYPLKSDDSGSTQVARVGADGDTLETLSDQIDGVQTSLDGVQNNTRFVATVPTNMLVPDSGDTMYKITVHFYDSDGNMEDPDSNEIDVLYEDVSGTDKDAFYDDAAGTTPATAGVIDANMWKMVKISTGVYETYYKLPSTESAEQWTASFKLNEASTLLQYARSTNVVDENPGSTTLADNTTNADIIAQALKERDVSTTGAVSGSIYKDINDNIDANETKIDTIDTVVDGIQTDLDNATDGLGAIKTAVDANQTDLTNIESKVDTVDTVVDGIQTDLDNATDGLGAIKTAVDANQADLTSIEGKIDTVDTVVDGIQTDLDNATDGLGAIKSAIDGLNDLSAAEVNAEVDTALVDIKLDHLLAVAESDDVADNSVIAKLATKGSPTADWTSFNNATDSLEAQSDALATVDTVVDGIQTDLDNATDGLGAIKTAVDANQTDLTNIESKVDTVDTVVDGIQTDLDNATDGLGAIKTAVDANQTDLTNIESKVDTVDTVVDGIQTDLDNATDGLGAIKTAVDANQTDLTNIEGKVDIIDTNVDDIETAIGTPVALDLGTASIAGMLTKMADDNGGLDFDATTDSLEKIATLSSTIDGKVDTVDTVVDGIQTDLDNATDGLGAIKAAVDANQADLTSIESKVDTVDTVVDGIQTDLDNATDGLGAIKAAVDANQADLTIIEGKVDTVDTVVDSIVDDTGTSGVVLANDAITAAKFDETTAYPLKSDDSGSTQVARVGADGDTLETLSDQIDGVQTSLDGVQNNTRFVATVPTSMLIPDSGDTMYKITVNFYDTDGNMEDPDSNEIDILYENVAGGDKDAFYDDAAGTTPATAGVIDANMWKMVKIGTGIYETYYKLPNTETAEQWTASFKLNESSTLLQYARSTNVVEENPGSTTLADNTTNADIIAQALKERDVSGVSAVLGSIHKDIMDNIDANETKIDTIDTVVDGIQTDLDNATDGLGAIKTAVDANQADLTTIESKVDTVDTVVDGIQTDLDNATDGLGAIKTAVDGVQTDLDNATDGLGAIKTAVDANQTDLTSIESKVDTVDTVVDGIQTDLDNATDGLGAIKTAVDANQADLTNIETKVDTVDTVVDAIKVQTDKLTFNVANVILADIREVNDVAVTGVDDFKADASDVAGADVNTTTIEGADATNQIVASVDASIESYGLDHLVAVSVTGTDVADDSIIANLVSKHATTPDWDNFDNTTDSLEAISDSLSGSALTQQNVRDAMKLAPTGGVPAAGSVDEHLDDILTDTGTTLDGKIDTIDTVVDGIQTDLDNGTDGLGAIKAAVDANQADLTSIEGKVDTVDTVVDGIQTDLDNGIDGLGAIKAAVDANQADLTTIDTVVDGIQTDLDNATDGLGAIKAAVDANQADLTSIESKVDTVDTVVDGIQTDLDNATDGLGAIKAAVDANQADLTTIEGKVDTVDTVVDSILDDTGTSGVVLANDAITAAKYDETTAYPLKSDDSGSTQVARVGADGDTLEDLSDQIDGVQTSVDGIQNNTRFVATIPNNMLIPDTGDTMYKLTVHFYDTDGNMEDPDSNEIDVLYEDVSGGDKDAFYDDSAGTTPATAGVIDTNMWKMVRIGVGIYETYYKLPNTENVGQWTASFKLNEASALLQYARSSSIVEENPGSATLADNTINKDIIAEALKERDVSGTGAVFGSIYKDINDNIDANETKIDTVDTVVDGIQTDLDNATDGLGAIKAAVDANQADLTTIEGKVDTIDSEVGTIDTVVDGIQSDLDNATDGLGAIKAAVDVNQADLTTIEGKIDTIDSEVGTIDTVVDGIQSDLDNATDGLGAIKAAVDANQADLTTIEGKVDTVDTVVDGIQTDLDNATDGLGAIKGAVDANQADLTNIETKVDTVDIVVDGIQSDLDNATDGLGAIKTVVDANQADLTTIDGKVDTIDTVVDGIQTDLDNATDGLGAIKAAVDANQTDLTTIDGKIDTIDTEVGVIDGVVDGIQSDLDNGIDGLGAIKAAVDANQVDLTTIEGKIDTIDTEVGVIDTVVDGIQADLDNGADGLGAIKAAVDTVDTVVDGIQTDLDNGVDGLGAIKAAIDANQADLVNIETKIDTVDTVVDGIQTDLDNGIDGLGAIKGAVDANQADLTNIEGKVDIVDTVVDGIQSDLDNATDGLGALKAEIDSNGSKLDTIITNVGTAIALDGGSASLAGMLTKIADDNNGADYDATTDSLNKSTAGGDWTNAEKAQIRDAIGVDGSKTTAVNGQIQGLSDDLSDVSSIVDDIRDNVGTPVSLDGGLSTLAGMLIRMADDNDGADFDSEQDSLHEIGLASGGTDWTSGEKQQLRDALGIDGNKNAATNGQLQDVKSDAADIKSAVEDGTFGVEAIKNAIDLIKAVTDLLPNGGALTSIAKEATLGTPSVSITDDIAEVLTEITGVRTEIDNPTYGLSALKTAIEAIDVEGFLDEVLDGSATVRIGLQKILAYCAGKINRLGQVYTYRNFDDTADEMIHTTSGGPPADTRTRS